MSDSRTFGSHADVLPIGQSGAHADTAVDLSQHVFQMRVADAGAPHQQTQERTPTQDTTRMASVITSDGGPQLSPAEADFERLMTTIKQHPDQYAANVPAIDRALSQADASFYQALDHSTQAIKQFEPGYDNAVKQREAGFINARTALSQIPADQRDQAVSDIQHYLTHPTPELKQRLQGYEPSGKELLGALDKIAAVNANPDYIGGERLRRQAQEGMQDSIMFRRVYGEVLANELHMAGPALEQIWQEKHMMREAAAGKRLD